MDITPIPTRYKGYHFRSRTEARWAVFLDSLELEWQYEHQVFDIEGEKYLPDFWLPQRRLFLEVKGQWPNDQERNKAELLSKATDRHVLMVIGVPSDKDGGYVPFGFEGQIRLPIRPISQRLSLALENDNDGSWGESLLCPVCGFKYVHFTDPPSDFTPNDDYKAWEGRGSALRIPMWGECGHEFEIRLGFHKGNMYVVVENCIEIKHGPVLLAEGDQERFDVAVQAARSARFEHGESGAT